MKDIKDKLKVLKSNYINMSKQISELSISKGINTAKN